MGGVKVLIITFAIFGRAIPGTSTYFLFLLGYSAIILIIGIIWLIIEKTYMKKVKGNAGTIILPQPTLQPSVVSTPPPGTVPMPMQPSATLTPPSSPSPQMGYIPPPPTSYPPSTTPSMQGPGYGARPAPPAYPQPLQSTQQPTIQPPTQNPQYPTQPPPYPAQQPPQNPQYPPQQPSTPY